MNISKQKLYRSLIEEARKSYPPQGTDGEEMTWCDDCNDEINLWTYWQGRGNLNPEILLVGQDWGDPTSKEGKASLENIRNGRSYLEDDIFPSDLNLTKLFDEAFNIDISKPNERLFFTNLILGYRTAGNSGSLNAEQRDHDLPLFVWLVHLLDPKIIICLGADTFKGVLKALEVKVPFSGSFNDALDKEHNIAKLDDITIYGVAHPGSLGCLNRARKDGANVEVGLKQQIEDWKRIKLL